MNRNYKKKKIKKKKHLLVINLNNLIFLSLYHIINSMNTYAIRQGMYTLPN
jgi:hypothetical protein